MRNLGRVGWRWRLGWAQRSVLASTFSLSPVSNPLLLLAFAAGLGPLLLMLYTTPGQLLARTEPLDPVAWLLAVALLPLPLLGAEATKALLRRRQV